MQAASVTAPAGSTRHTAFEKRLVKPKTTLFHNEFEIWSVACWGGRDGGGRLPPPAGCAWGQGAAAPGLVPGPPLAPGAGLLTAAEGNCRASGSRLPSPGGSSALSPARGDPGTMGEGAAPAAPFIPCTRCPARPRPTLRGAGGEERVGRHPSGSGGMRLPTSLCSTPLSEAGRHRRPGKEEQQLEAASRSRAALAGHPPPPTRSPHVCGEAQGSPAFVGRDGGLPGHKTAFPPPPAPAGTPQT